MQIEVADGAYDNSRRCSGMLGRAPLGEIQERQTRQGHHDTPACDMPRLMRLLH